MEEGEGRRERIKEGRRESERETGVSASHQKLQHQNKGLGEGHVWRRLWYCRQVGREFGADKLGD